MEEKYAVKVDLNIEGHHKAAYVGHSTRLYDPASYVSVVAARLWKRRSAAEKFIKDNAERLPAGARVTTFTA
jgi:hypothetical protein